MDITFDGVPITDKLCEWLSLFENWTLKWVCYLYAITLPIFIILYLISLKYVNLMFEDYSAGLSIIVLLFSSYFIFRICIIWIDIVISMVERRELTTPYMKQILKMDPLHSSPYYNSFINCVYMCVIGMFVVYGMIYAGTIPDIMTWIFLVVVILIDLSQILVIISIIDFGREAFSYARDTRNIRIIKNSMKKSS